MDNVEVLNLLDFNLFILFISSLEFFIDQTRFIPSLS